MANAENRLNSSLSDANFKVSCATVLDKLVRRDQPSIDSILAHDNPQQPQIVLPDGRKFVWYLAIGSMINPISLYLRDLTPIASYPAVCPDYQLAFKGANGMGDIEACAQGAFHGVVHLLSDEQMAQLDKIESLYRRIVVTVADYQDKLRMAYAYKMDSNNQAVNPPTERYLDIIVKGCEYYHVRQEYIDRLKHEQAVVPRKKPSTFQSFDNVPNNAFHTVEEIARHNASSSTLSLWVCINGKVLEYAGLPPTDHPDYEQQRRFYSFFQPLFGGRVVDFGMARALYEPLYKLPLSEEDLTDEHRAMLEDTFVDMVVNSAPNKDQWKPIGRLQKTKKSRFCVLI